MNHIIHVHHYYTDILFQKLFHNVKNKKILEIDNIWLGIGRVTFEYKENNFEAIFNPEINDNEGHHIIDFFGVLRQRDRNKLFADTQLKGSDSHTIIQRIGELIEHKKNWIICLFRTEKIFIKNDSAKVKTDGTVQIEEIENQILRLSNHTVLTDNIFINDIIHEKYPNTYHPFTNIIFQWNEMISIRWFYDYKNISDVISPKYKMGYSIRAHKPHRIKTAEELVKINDVFVSQTNVITDDRMRPKFEIIEGAHLNDYDSEIDFHNLRIISNITVGLDYFLRILPMSKIQICDESWANNPEDYTSQYLSEKSIGLILANVPFICTHSYPYECLTKLAGIRQHPFYTQSKEYQGKPKKFAEFVKNFIDNFDINYQLVKEWVQECHNIFMERLYIENSMLDMLLEKSPIKREPIKRPLI